VNLNAFTTAHVTIIYQTCGKLSALFSFASAWRCYFPFTGKDLTALLACFGWIKTNR
jgi:hypothetical protein